ncbi:hypothetical protein [Hymenobacter sp. B81]|uniref:hypothetical protein n=1 Tax=Hymenobacter sp. B81 TaxID=3344878 RepID=UPI0037DCA34F
MSSSLRLLAFGLLLAVGASCSRDQAPQNPRGYGTVSTKSTNRPNDKSRFRDNRPAGPVGLGVDTKAKNPYKFQTVKAPKRYKYGKAK